MSLDAPKISVIVPVYNSESYLHECLESIIHQSLSDLEIICINDGSVDNSEKILLNYVEKDNRIRISNKKNGGLSSARNVGIKLAIGEYIAFIDSDDWIDPLYLEKLYFMAVENKADISMGNLVRFFTDSNEVEGISWIGNLINTIDTDVVDKTKDRKIVMETNSVCNKLFSRKFLITYDFLFYEGLFWEDNPFTIMTTLKANRIAIVRDVFYHNRKHNKSITSAAVSDRKPFDIFTIMNNLKVFFEHEGIASMSGYKYYYEDLIYRYYLNQLLYRINKIFRKEFYYRVKTEFMKLDQQSIAFLSSRYFLFRLIRHSNYFFFNFFQFCILIFRRLYYFFHSFVRIIKKIFLKDSDKRLLTWKKKS